MQFQRCMVQFPSLTQKLLKVNDFSSIYHHLESIVRLWLLSLDSNQRNERFNRKRRGFESGKLLMNLPCQPPMNASELLSENCINIRNQLRSMTYRRNFSFIIFLFYDVSFSAYVYLFISFPTPTKKDTRLVSSRRNLTQSKKEKKAWCHSLVRCFLQIWY